MLEPAKVATCIITVKPRAPLAEMSAALSQGDLARGTKLAEALNPLFKIVPVKIMEEYEGFQIPCKFRNPSAIKTLMRGLGMPVGPCRHPPGADDPQGHCNSESGNQDRLREEQKVLAPPSRTFII